MSHNQLTSLLSNNHHYLIINSQLSRKFGTIFSLFFSSVITKYQGLIKTGYIKENEDFWLTASETLNAVGISYYLRKKAIDYGIQLGLWSVEYKYNSNYKGTINKITHFKLDIERIQKFFGKLEELQDNQEADEKLENEADELRDQDKKRGYSSEVEELYTQEIIEEFVNEFSTKSNIKNSVAYKATLYLKIANRDKKTLITLREWLKEHNKAKEINYIGFEEEYKIYKNRQFSLDGNKHKIIGMRYEYPDVILQTQINKTNKIAVFKFNQYSHLEHLKGFLGANQIQIEGEKR